MCRGVHLLCCNQAGPVHGRQENAAFAAGMFGDTIDEEIMGRVYIDVSGSVVEYRFPAGPDDDRPANGAHPVDYDQLQVSEHGPDGAATRNVHPMALQVLQSPVDDGRAPYGEDLGGAKRLADRYLTAWSGRDGTAVGELYAANATLVDSLLRVRLTGRDAIGSYAAQNGGVRLRQESIPGGGGPALYGYWAELPGPLTAYLTYTGDDGEQCPGGVTTELQIEQGKIVAERRYHDVASMRRCVERAELPDGWWTHAVIAPFEDRVTGTVTAAGQRIVMHNGTPGADDLVIWAMARFPTAKLKAPVVASVAFTEEAHRDQCSTGRWGLAIWTGSDYRIFLCYTVATVATSLERTMMLHELAHVWMWQNLNERTQEDFLARMQLSSWDASDVPSWQRGIEQAAGVVAWGLGDENLKSEVLPNRSCSELADAFELLTGAVPLQPPCPQGE